MLTAGTALSAGYYSNPGSFYPSRPKPVLSKSTNKINSSPNDIPQSQPNTILQTGGGGDRFGTSVSGAGDLNGDGYSDVLVGAALYPYGDGRKGAVFVYYGSSTGLNNAAPTVLKDHTAGGGDSGLGTSISCAGDVNGDGFSDIVVFARSQVWVYHGSATGVAADPNTILNNPIPSGTSSFGTLLAGAGDINGDGFSDIVVSDSLHSNGENAEGAAFIYFGSSSGLATTPAATLEGNTANEHLGTSVSGAGDVNGDGFGDIVVASQTGARMYYGSGSGINTSDYTSLPGQAASVSAAGDVNGDGFSDIIMGPGGADGLRMFHGSVTGINPAIAAIIKVDGAEPGFGYAVSGAGDINGDGFSDIIISNQTHPQLQGPGDAYIFKGSATGIAATPSSRITTNQNDASTGPISGAGDVNGDGFSDVIAGSEWYNGAQGAAFVVHGFADKVGKTPSIAVEGNQMGAQLSYVSGAGDVNGDGYSDILVWAMQRGGPAQTTVGPGAVYVYFGSANGINTASKTTLNLTGYEINDGWRRQSAGMGDVNGDGYSDIVVGANGALLLYTGSASGINTNPAQILTQFTGPNPTGVGDTNGDGYADLAVGDPAENKVYFYYGSRQGFKSTPITFFSQDWYRHNFGIEVSGAGDVNGDGFSDFMVTTEGNPYEYISTKVDIFFGSYYGPFPIAEHSTISGWTDAFFGRSMAGAGDINGDGFDDIVAGVPYYRVEWAYRGGLYVYYGSSKGINSTGTLILSGQDASYLGYDVSSAGDVNGDGYADVLVGAYGYDGSQTDQGAAFIYLGGPGGLSTVPWDTLVIDKADAGLGFTVALAGDVNGDGFSDVLTGSEIYSEGETNEGAVFLFQGNGGGGMQRNLRLYNAGTNEPIDKSNVNSDQFGAGLFAKNPDGRSKGKLVWETISTGQVFSSGSPITNSTHFTGQQPAFTDLGTNGSPLTEDLTKTGLSTRIRARVRYDPVTSLNGEVFSPWIYIKDIFGPQNGRALPVELVYFKAKEIENRVVRLDWQTESETNNSFFTVEKSRDARVWTEVNRIDGAVASASVLNYQSFDRKVETGKTYYRLKQTDVDGKFTYSSIAFVTIADHPKSIVYPNPASDEVMLEGDPAEIDNLDIIDDQGRNVTNQIQVSTINKGSKKLILENLLPGIYLIRTKSETLRIHKGK